MAFLITKELSFGFQILDLKDHFSAFLKKNTVVFIRGRHLLEGVAFISLFPSQMRCLLEGGVYKRKYNNHIV